MDVEALLELEEQFEEYAALCKCGMRTVLARIENLQDEIELSNERNIYDVIISRIKLFDHTIDKLDRKNLEHNIEAIKANIRDIAGIRIITLFKDDVYKIRDALIKQPSMEVLEERDYIKNPKETGYRSYHLIVAMHIYFRERAISVPVEIQIRTKNEDNWASLEHHTRYKNEFLSDEDMSEESIAKRDKMLQELSDEYDRFDDLMIQLRDTYTKPQ